LKNGQVKGRKNGHCLVGGRQPGVRRGKGPKKRSRGKNGGSPANSRIVRHERRKRFSTRDAGKREEIVDVFD